MLGKIEGRRRSRWQKMSWLDSITDSRDMSLSQLGSKARFPEDSQCLCHVRRMRILTWCSETSQQWENFFFGIIVLQFVGHPLSAYGIWFLHDFAPPTILLWLLLCLWTCGIFFSGFQASPVDGCLIVSSDFGVLTGEDERTYFCSAILNQKSRK